MRFTDCCITLVMCALSDEEPIYWPSVSLIIQSILIRLIHPNGGKVLLSKVPGDKMLVTSG